MKFKNKKTKVIVETTVKAIEEMYKRKADFEEIKEVKAEEETKTQE